MTDNTRFYGIGKGSAQVLDTSGVLNQYQNLLAKQQLQRQQEIKQLTDAQAQLKPEGLRNDADRKDFFNQVTDWRTKSITAQQERDPYKKSLLKSQADQAYLKAQLLADQSKKAAQQELAFSTQLLNPAIRDRYGDDAVQRVIKNRELGINDPNHIKDFNTLEQQADHTKFLKATQDADKQLLNKAKYEQQLVKNKIGTSIQNYRAVPDEVRVETYKNIAKADRNFKKSLMDLYPDVFANPDLNYDQQIDEAARRVVKTSGALTEFNAPQQKVDPQPDRFYEHYNYALAHPKGGGGSDNPAPMPTNIVLPFKEGEAKVNVSGYVPLSLPKRNFAGSAAYDLTSGQKVQALASSGEYSIVGVGNFPFTKNGTLATPENQAKNPKVISEKPMVQVQSTNKYGRTTDYLIEYDKLPANVKSSKAIQEALKNFVPASGKPATNATPKNITYKGKTYTQSAIDAAAKASGMSVNEYLKALGQ